MNPMRIWKVFWVNVLIFMRDKGGLFFTFAFPLILMLLFGFIFQDSDRTEYDIHVQDLDVSSGSSNFTMMLKHVPNFRYHNVSASDDPKELAKNHNVDFMIVIPHGFGENFTKRISHETDSPANITVLYDPSVSSSAVKLSILGSVLKELNSGILNTTDAIGYGTGSLVSTKFSFIEFFIPGVIGLTVMTGAVFGTIFGDLELKQKGIFRKLSTTPITRGEWILSNMLFQLFSAGLSVAVILFIGWLVFGTNLYLNPVFILVIIFEAFAFTGIAMLVVRFVKEAQSASAVGNVITFPMMFLAGTFFEVAAMPPFVQTIAKTLPLYYVNEALRQAMIFNNTIEALKQMSVIAVIAVIVFVAGVYFTTWRNE
jgi:ABC-2 type transport system permease protein